MKRRSVLSAAGLLATAGCLRTEDLDGSDESEFLDASGDIDIFVDSEAVDLSADRFQSEHADNESLAFHLHESDDQWYMESREPVTFAEGVGLLPHFAYRNEDGHHVLTVDGVEYDEREGAVIEFFVDSEAVYPTEHELQDGDALRIEIETGG